MAKPCDRCSIPDIDPITGLRDPQYLMTRTLRTFRSGAHLGGTLERIFFAVNFVHLPHTVGKTLHLGDQVKILKTGKPNYP